MTKKITVAGMSINIPEYNNSIGKAVQHIQNEYEAGNISALFVVFAYKDGVQHLNVGNPMIVPFVSMAAITYANAALDEVEDGLLGMSDDEED